MTLLALSFTMLLIIATMLISYWQKIGLEKEIAIGTIRSAIQLLAVGYVLQYIFRTEHVIYLFLIMEIKISAASWNANKRGEGMKGLIWRIAVSITTMEVLMMALLLSMHIIQPNPNISFSKKYYYDD